LPARLDAAHYIVESHDGSDLRYLQLAHKLFITDRFLKNSNELQNIIIKHINSANSYNLFKPESKQKQIPEIQIIQPTQLIL